MNEIRKNRIIILFNHQENLNKSIIIKFNELFIFLIKFLRLILKKKKTNDQNLFQLISNCWIDSENENF